MNKFVKGMLVGIGIGLLIAPMKGEETRRKFGERIQQLRAYLPEGDQLDSYKQQISGRVSQTTEFIERLRSTSSLNGKVRCEKHC